MTRPVLCLLLVIAIGPSAAAGRPRPTVAEVRRDVTRLGPTATVQGLWRDGRWSVVEDRIAAGQADWIALAPMLAQGTDAGTAEGLSISLAQALPRNPRAVLAVVRLEPGRVLSLQRVCAAPFIEETAEHHAIYTRAAFKALAGAMEASLEPARRACLEQLRHSR
jgi:hypothetical protein